MKKSASIMNSCLLLRQFLCLALVITSSLAYAGGIPDDDMILTPDKRDHWADELMIEDDAGVLKQMKSQVNHWHSTEEYASKWDIESTGLYNVIPRDAQTAFFKRYMLKYLDKRLSGEAKRAEEGTTLHRVHTAQKALKPSTAVAISDNYKIKIRAKVLQMKGNIVFVNPFVDANAEYSLSQGTTFNFGRHLASLGINANLTYSVENANYVASLSKQLTTTISTTVSSHQADSQLVMSEQSNRTVRVNYSKGF